MTRHTISIPALLDKGSMAFERVAAFRAEEVAHVVFAARGEDDFAFDGGLAGAAAGGEEFVEVEVAVEAEGVVGAVESVVFQALETFVVRFGVECYAFEGGVAVCAGEAGGVEEGFLRLRGV